MKIFPLLQRKSLQYEQTLVKKFILLIDLCFIKQLVILCSGEMDYKVFAKLILFR